MGFDRLQLHGGEPNELVARLGALAFKAVRIGAAEDVLRAARSFPDARSLPMGTRLRRACADALRALSPL